MSLRLRLILAFLAVVSLILLVGVVAYIVNERVRTEVTGLRARGALDLRQIDLSKVGLEVEGYWNPGGSFVATDVEILEKLERPRLRGAIQDVDEDGRRITLYGVAIHVPDDTESADAKGEVVQFADLVPGKRVEVTCEVDDSRWKARRIKLRNVKSSDKIKGTVTSATLDGEAPETVEIHGLVILLEASVSVGPESSLGRIGMAVQMSLALQECRVAARALVDRTSARPRIDGEPGDPADRLLQAAENFGRLFLQSQPAGDDLSPSSASTELLPGLQPMTRNQEKLDGHVAALQELVRDDPERAGEYLDSVFEPFLEDELIPLVYANLSQAEEDLGDQLREVQARTATTTKVALAMSGLAVVVAVVLGVLVWRSVDRPIRALHSAAVRLGHGHLDTRVEVTSRDEIGVLADAFNHMATELATSTVSVQSLESVFDSMAGALILLDPQGRITNVNRAAQDLVGYARQELIGRSLDFICRRSANETAGPVVKPRDGGAMAIVEKTFLRKDGSEVPVSFSGAELRSQDGPLQGYVCVAQDLTEQKNIETHVRSSLAEKELLLREVHHRVKNNMQVISSLLAMQSSCASDPQTVDNLEQSQSRIRSMALIHEQLHQSTGLAEIDIRAYMEVLTAHLLQSFGRAQSVDLELRVADVNMDIDQSLACGLIVNELVTNALKHAFPEGRTGTVLVSLSEDPSGDRVLAVSDDGVGIGAAGAGDSGTLGLSLVRTLAQQLRGRIEIRGEGGTAVRIVFQRSTQGARS